MTQIFDMHAIEEAKITLKDKFPKFVSYFLEDSEAYVTQIRNFASNGDYKEVVAPAHTLKSSSKQMGAMKLSELARKIEEGARNDKPELVELVPELEKAYKEVADNISKL